LATIMTLSKCRFSERMYEVATTPVEGKDLGNTFHFWTRSQTLQSIFVDNPVCNHCLRRHSS
jgi:hypothetical protein